MNSYILLLFPYSNLNFVNISMRILNHQILQIVIVFFIASYYLFRLYVCYYTYKY